MISLTLSYENVKWSCMNPTLNYAKVIGYVHKEPVFHRFQTGKQLVNFSLRTHEEEIKKGRDTGFDRVQIHGIVIDNPSLFDYIRDHIHKDDLLLIEGELRTRTFIEIIQAHQGDEISTKKSVTEIVVRTNKGVLQKLNGEYDDLDCD